MPALDPAPMLESAPTPTSRAAYSYDSVAWCYEGIARVYSLGCIQRCKRSQIDELGAGDRVLYVGVGAGEDALLAARRGAEVTGLDLSPAMLSRTRRRFAAEGLPARWLEGDLFDHRSSEPYDAVAANFVLNVLPESWLDRALAQLGGLLRPGGKLLIADFAVPGGGCFERTLSAAYYWPVALAARVLGLCCLHPIHDYTLHLDAGHCDLVARTRFGLAPKLPAFFESLVAVRRG
jgi:demethylmenaquinone methyltransferase/2-methoxy-6-polyprenyl-1,4-benzoquinol methylase